MSSGHGSNCSPCTTKKQPVDGQRPSTSTLPTSITLEGSNSKSPLKIPQGVIVRTPSGRDCQGRKTPPRFFAVTNEQLLQMHSSASSADKEPFGPKHFRFKDENQTADEGSKCFCTNSVGKTEMSKPLNQKDIKKSTKKTGGMITLKSLLEGEIHRSNTTQTPKEEKVDTKLKQLKITQLSSHSASLRPTDSPHMVSCTQKQRESATDETAGESGKLTIVNHDARAVTVTASPLENNTSNSMLSATKLFNHTDLPSPLKAIDSSSSECNTDGSSLGLSSECRLAIPDNEVPKGSLLDMLLSSTEPLVKHRICAPSSKKGDRNRSKITTADINDPLDRTPTELPDLSPSKGTVTSKFTANSTKEIENINSQRKFEEERMLVQAAKSKSSYISRNPEESPSRPTQTCTSVSRVHTEQLKTEQNEDEGSSAVILHKAESNVTSDISQRPSCSHLEAEPVETSRNSKTPEIPVSSLETMDVSLLTQSKNADVFHGFIASSNKVPDDSACGSVKRIDKTIAFDHCLKPSKTSENLNDDSTLRHEQKAKLPPKTTLIIAPVMTSSATAVSRCSGPSGQLYGLVHSSNNANGPVVLVALGSRPQSSNGSTTLTGTGSNVRGAKPQSSIPVMINNMALTGNTNTDAFNVWKSYVSQAYRDKYGDNYEYYMHNRWVSMTVAEKSPFVHQVSNRLSPSVVVQTPSNNSLTSNQETIVIKAPTTKNAKPSIQRQINVIPRLQTTGPDRIIADNPVSATERDVLGELYRSTNMADISSDFPRASSNDTLRKVTKGSSDFLTDPAASFDPLFARCLLSGRPYDIENWMAMKTNWRETPEWIVDFLADCDERKRARRAAIDAAVMRRVAMVQRMTGEQDDDDDADTYTVQTPQKHIDKKYPQFGDIKENTCTPTCQKKTHQSESTEGSLPHEDASYSKKDDKCLTPTKVKTATCTQTKGPELINGMLHDQITTGQSKTSGSNKFQRSPFLKPESKPKIIATTIPNAEHKTVSPDISSSTREDEGSSNALPTQNTGNSSLVSQEYRVHSQDVNDLGNLDLINDEELWNIQCSLFPPWQRVLSFIDADAAENFFKNLDKDLIQVSVRLVPEFFSYVEQKENVAEEETTRMKNHLQHNPVDEYAKSFGHEYGAQHDKFCGKALPSTSSLIKEANDTDNVSIILSPISHFGNDEGKPFDTPRVRRCLFSGISFKNECQSERYEPTELLKSSPTQISKSFAIKEDQNGREESGKWVASSVNHQDIIDIQRAYPISRQAEEDAAVSKLLEILEEQGSSERLDTKEMATNQNNVLTKGRSTSEKMDNAACSVIPERACEMQGTTLRRPQLANEIDEWLREVVVPSPVKKPWNEMTRAEDNNHSSGEKNGSPFKNETQRDPVLETTHNLLVDHGIPDPHNSVSHITRKTEEEEKKSRKIERWHEEIQPIIALAVNSSSSSCSVENEVRTTHYEDEPRTTPTVELQAFMKGVQASKNRKGDQKADITEKPKVIPTIASSSGEYLTADETDLHSGGFDNRGTPEPCIIKTEHSDEIPQRTHESSSPKVFACGTTTSGQCGDGDILDGDIDKGGSNEEERTNGAARKNHGRMRKKRRQESRLDDRPGNTPQTYLNVPLSSSDASVTSIASSSSSSSSRITTSRKGRGKKRRRKKKRRNDKSEWNVARDASSPSESHTSREAKDKVPLHRDVDSDESEGDASTMTCIEKSSPRWNLHPGINNSQQDRSPKPQSGCTDHVGEDGSGDDSSDEFVIEDHSPTSPLKIVMRRSSRLKIQRVSKLPRLRSRRYSSVALPVKSSRKFIKKTIHRRQNRVK